jgi:hypothetical protein
MQHQKKKLMQHSYGSTTTSHAVVLHMVKSNMKHEKMETTQ